eukprot:4663805-Alexandrium_andersonii.AAC.1
MQSGNGRPSPLCPTDCPAADCSATAPCAADDRVERATDALARPRAFALEPIDDALPDAVREVREAGADLVVEAKAPRPIDPALARLVRLVPLEEHVAGAAEARPAALGWARRAAPQPTELLEPGADRCLESATERGRQ